MNEQVSDTGSGEPLVFNIFFSIYIQNVHINFKNHEKKYSFILLFFLYSILGIKELTLPGRQVGK